jgi:ABC-type polysaccharide/polyol phosphate transport system ATPase subunit
MSRSPRLTLKYCEQHGVLRDGKIIMCDSHEEACYLFEHD